MRFILIFSIALKRIMCGSAMVFDIRKTFVSAVYIDQQKQYKFVDYIASFTYFSLTAKKMSK